MSSHINIEGPLFIQDTEDGRTSNNIPFEIYSDYSLDPTNTYFRQLNFSDSVYMGVSNVGSYFYISEPSVSAMSEQSNTFIITSSGVGLGKTNPSDSLHVEGESKVSGTLNVVGDLITTNVYASSITFGKLDVNGDANHRIPSGTVALWENVSNIPDGWKALFTTLNDLSTRFVRGGTSIIGATGGENTATIEISNFPSHSHNTSSNTFTIGDHNHDLNVSLGSTGEATHYHTSTLVFDYQGDHTHSRTDADPCYPNIPFNSKTAYYAQAAAGGRSAYNTEASNHRTTNISNEISSHGHSFAYPDSKNLLSEDVNHSHSINNPNNTVKLNSAAWAHNNNNDPTDGADDSGNTNSSIIPQYKSYVFIVKE